MATDIVPQVMQGPEIIGMRLTVYHLLPYFIETTKTEAEIAELHNITPQQVASARAYVFNHLDEVLTRHLQIEQRISVGNPPEVIEQAQRVRSSMLKFKAWLAYKREEEKRWEERAASGFVEQNRLPSFEDWLAAQQNAS